VFVDAMDRAAAAVEIAQSESLPSRKLSRNAIAVAVDM